jgi:CHASE2 domain-containing sensor protein
MVLAHRTAGMAADFPLDLSIDPQTIPRLSALDVIRGSVPMNAIAEKDVVISYTNTPIDFPFVIPNRGEFATVYLHIIGAETLKRRPVFELKWFFTFIPALCLVLACWRIRRARFTAISLASGAATILLLPFALEPYAVFYDSMAALMLWTIVAVGLTYRARREARLLRFAAERPPAQTTDTAYSSALANNQTAC